MRIRVLALVVATAALVIAAPAFARDTHAPANSSDNWLPCDAWVMFHWVPFDEPQLYAELGMSRDAVRGWLRDDDHHTLAQLFKQRGLTVRQAAARLVPEGGVRRDHAIDTLTQGHLAQHLLFHYFHQPLIGSRAARIFGVSPVKFRQLRLQGMSPAEIGRAHGRTPGQLRYRAYHLLTYASHAGIRAGEVTPEQAADFLRTQHRGLGHWLASHIRKPGAGRPWTPRNPAHMAMLCFLLRGDTGE